MERRQFLAYMAKAVSAVAATWATLDLGEPWVPEGLTPPGVDRPVGIAMRYVQQYDVAIDRFPCKLDVIYGMGVIRPEWAGRLGVLDGISTDGPS